MSEHKKFSYNTLDEMKQDIRDMGSNIPMSTDLDILKQPVRIGDRMAPNRLAIHPMEGCDGTADGKPGELTYRRYERFARGGAGLLWFEATAVVNEARANPRQIYICEENQKDFEKMLNLSLNAAKEEFGESFKPYTVLQLTHSGRYSKPGEKPSPIIAARNPYLDKNIPDDYPVVTDDYLQRMEDKFVEAAEMAARAGFDAVDIKACHRYLNSELLSAFTREGMYGGSFENRTRFMLNIIDKIKDRLGGKIAVTTRMNAYDAIPYPYGFGVDKEDFHKPDLTEPKKLIRILRDKGLSLVNVSVGNPYYNPHVGRPYDNGPYTPPNHPLESTHTILNVMREMQQEVPEITLVGTGLTWLREFAANVAAGCIEKGWFKIAGFGRQGFAYPDFARDIIEKNQMFRGKCCITCTNCSVIMRDNGRTGCVPKDAKIYMPIYKEGREGKPPIAGTQIAEHV